MECKYCKKPIKENRQFCSGSCAGAYSSIHKKGLTKNVNCDKCGKVLKTSLRGPNIVVCADCKKTKKQISGICEYCGKEHDGSFGSGRFCSSQCARAYSTHNKRKQINKKVSETMKLRYPKKSYIKHCEYCNKEFTTTNKNKKFCNMSCGVKNLFKLGKFTGGLTKLGGQKHYKKGYYDNNYFDSGWELAYWLYCKDNNISIQRNSQGFEYIFDGKKRKYYPDFIVNGEYIEIKGYVTDRDKAKFKAVKVKVVTKSEMKGILEQVINKHGESYISRLVKDNS